MNTCRFCKKSEHLESAAGLVKYGVRHYAHPKCYLDAGKSLDDISDWQIGKFPHRLLKDRGLLEAALVRLSKAEAEQ